MSAFAKDSREPQRSYYLMRFNVDAEPLHAAPHRSESVDRLEVVLPEVVGDLVAEHSSLGIGSAEVDAAPHSGVDDLLERVGEALEAPCGAGFVAESAEGDFVGAEKVLERVHYRTTHAGVTRWMVGKGWCNE